jgi:pimeloyl-ACP methyl ester carboxylesterase
LTRAIGEFEPRQRTKLVLLPGLDGTGELFAWLLAALPLTIEPIVISYPKDILGGYDALEAYIRAQLPQGQFAVVGESFSSPLALRLSARRDSCIIAVILIAGFARHPVGWLPTWVRHLVRPAIFKMPLPPLLLKWALAGNDAPANVVFHTKKALRSVSSTSLADRVCAALTVDVADATKRCRAPILYIRGTQDRLINRSALVDLKTLQPDLQVEDVVAPHFILQRAPGASADAIMRFLSDRKMA